MKKLFALLMALVLTAAMMTSAMAYTAVKPTNGQPAITHTLELTSDDMDSLAYDIEYSFAVGAAEVVQPEGVTDTAKAVTGAPTIANIKYTSEDTFSEGNKTCTKELQIDWAGVSIMEPGVYRWPVDKSFTDTDPADNPSNGKPATYLFAYVIDNNGKLQVETVGLTTDGTLSDAAGKGNFEDTYPINTLDLSIGKTVTGNQGSREQYFKFTVNLNAPAAIDATYPITGIDEQVPATAYHTAKTNPTTVTLEGGKATVELWLKHNQMAKIVGLLYGTSYTVVESENAGYEVTSVITGDTADITADGPTAGDTSLQSDSIVAFTNNKEATVPTGIVLESGAPIFGILLAMGLMLVMFIGKRREEAA